MAVRPTPRSIMVCERVEPDAVNPNRLSLLRVIHAIGPAVGSVYPLLQDELCVLAQLTEGRGEGSVRVEIRNADTEATVFRTGTRRVAFPGNDPLRVHGVKFRILNLPFHEPGLYWFQLWFDDAVLTQTPVVLRPAAFK